MSLSNGRKDDRVLIADDERIIADTLKQILEHFGFQAAAVYDGAAAVQKAQEWRPHYFVSDIMMPVLSGIDAALRICHMLPECKVLLISGQADLEGFRREIRAKCQNFDLLPKPVHPSELLERLQGL